MANFPLKSFDQNRIWLAIVTLAGHLQVWSGLLAFPTHEMRRWEPKKLRMHLYSVPATIVRTARRVVVHVKNTARWAGTIVAGPDPDSLLVSGFVRVEKAPEWDPRRPVATRGHRVMFGWQNQSPAHI